MESKVYLLLYSMLISLIALGQKQEKIYYDENWKGCSSSNAAFYRLVNFDNRNKPIGEVRDYFITGELQGKADSAIIIDKADDSKSKFIGISVGFYKTGAKQFEYLLDNFGNALSSKSWYENGNKKLESSNKNGEFYYITYYPSGKLFRKFGKLSDKFSIECDEFDKCQKVFFEAFQNTNNINEWGLITDNKDYSSYIIAQKGLFMESKNNGFRQTINIPLSLTENFSIATRIEFKSGSTNTGHGLIWGFRNWENYFYFYISANGYYRIGAKTEGVDLEFVKWTQSDKILQNFEKNLIKVIRVNDKMYFSINGSLVHAEDFYSFHGNEIGFSIGSGKKEVLFENLIVKQDIGNDYVRLDPSTSNFDGWKGNGTGFFISTNGYLATNYHVVEEASELEIEFIRNGQKQNYKVKVIQSDKQNDLAILKVDDNSFNPFSSIPYNFQTALTDVGSNVFALGYPMALSIMGTEIKFTDGKISSKTGFKGDISTYQMTTPIQPGNSGGPLFDFDGNLIGINSAIIRADVAENVSYAIKANYLKNLIDVLPITLNLPNDKTISNKILTEKIKLLSDYVVLIKVK